MNNTTSWAQLKAHYQEIQSTSINTLFDNNKQRFEQFSFSACDLVIDISKNKIDNEAMTLLLQLAEKSKLSEKITAMMSGHVINTTEQRAVLHTALRSKQKLEINQCDVQLEISAVLQRMRSFSDQVRNGDWLGCRGEKITDIVNIGIGGSDLGPKMVVEALKPYVIPSIKFHFISNIDGSDMTETLRHLNAQHTLFIIASKSFTTHETLTNANTAKSWFLSQLPGTSINKHFIALSTNKVAVKAFGIDTQYMFEFWDWVGGRFSLWSSIGISIAIAIGMDNFEALLSGANKMDAHFQNTPLAENLPVLLALVGLWNTNIVGCKNQAVIPYDHYLHRLPAYLQQAEMESNGKRVSKQGQPIDYQTVPVIFGEPGTNSQHAFFQMIHQGTQIIPVDFIIPLLSHNPIGEHHKILFANCIAQSEALMKGKSLAEVKNELQVENMTLEAVEALAPHKVFPGDRPSTMIILPKITPATLGSLIALYEHKIFTQGVIWDINSFDQWGVELGKHLANIILPELSADSKIESHDSSTNALINQFRQMH